MSTGLGGLRQRHIIVLAAFLLTVVANLSGEITDDHRRVGMVRECAVHLHESAVAFLAVRLCEFELTEKLEVVDEFDVPGSIFPAFADLRGDVIQQHEVSETLLHVTAPFFMDAARRICIARLLESVKTSLIIAILYSIIVLDILYNV